jgi:hypothetical protein
LFGFILAFFVTIGFSKASVAVGAFDLAYTCSERAAVAVVPEVVSIRAITVIHPIGFIFVICFLPAAATDI